MNCAFCNVAAALVKRWWPMLETGPVPGLGNSGSGGDSSSEPVSSKSVSEVVDCRDSEALRSDFEGGGGWFGDCSGCLLRWLGKVARPEAGVLVGAAEETLCGVLRGSNEPLDL